MFCKNCGAKLDDGNVFCIYCGQKISSIKTDNPKHQPGGNEPSTNPLCGKEYSFSGIKISSNNPKYQLGEYHTSKNPLFDKIEFSVKIEEKCLTIKGGPEDNIPAIMYNEIASVKIGPHIKFGLIVIGFISFILGIIGAKLEAPEDEILFLFIAPIAILLFFVTRKIKINLLNGDSLTFFTDKDSDVISLEKDIKEITNIK